MKYWGQLANLRDVEWVHCLFLFPFVLGKFIYNIQLEALQNPISMNNKFKGIFSDSNNIFLWHESEDINEKSLFPKFQLFPILRFQVMHDYVCFIAPIDYCVE